MKDVFQYIREKNPSVKDLTDDVTASLGAAQMAVTAVLQVVGIDTSNHHDKTCFHCAIDKMDSLKKYGEQEDTLIKKTLSDFCVPAMGIIATLTEFPSVAKVKDLVKQLDKVIMDAPNDWES